MTRDMKKLNKDTKKRRNSKKKNPSRVEKTIKVVKERDFVQRDDFNNIDDPMPDETYRDIMRKRKQIEKENEELNKAVLNDDYVDAKENIQRNITLSKSDSNQTDDDIFYADDDETEDDETVEDDESEKEKQKKEKKKKKNIKKFEKETSGTVTDIREARKKEKSKKRLKKIILIGVVCIFAAGVYATKELWVPKLEGILDRPHDTIINDGKTLEGNFPITFDENSVNTISYIDNLVLRVDDNHITLYDENGEVTTSFSHNYADPIVKVAGKRMLVYDNGGNNFEILSKKNQIFEKSVDEQILYASIANNSNVAVVTQTEKYASVLTVYDNNGSEIYTWSSNQRVLNVSFTSDGSGCYISTFEASGGSMKSKIHYITFDSTEEIMQSDTLDTLALDVSLNDNDDFWVVGDTKFYKLDNQGKILLEYEYTNELVDYAVSDTCAAVVFNGVQRKSGCLAVFSSDAETSTPDNVLYTEGGSPKKLKINSNRIVLLKANEIQAYDKTGNLLATATVSSEYVDFTFLNENVYFLGYRKINKISFAT